jgi:hypothetical protein
MIKSRRQADIATLIDLHSDAAMAAIEKLEPSPPPAQPRVAPHAPGCWCTPCWNAGLRYGEYLKAKRLNEL